MPYFILTFNYGSVLLNQLICCGNNYKSCNDVQAGTRNFCSYSLTWLFGNLKLTTVGIGTRFTLYDYCSILELNLGSRNIAQSEGFGVQILPLNTVFLKNPKQILLCSYISLASPHYFCLLVIIIQQVKVQIFFYVGDRSSQQVICFQARIKYLTQSLKLCALYFHRVSSILPASSV